MATRHPNHGLVRIHRTYTIDEVASLFGYHRNSVHEWLNKGLQTIDKRHPRLILGEHLIKFLKVRRKSTKRPCQPGEIYCLRCRELKVPEGKSVIYQPRTHNLGNLVGICPDCKNRMFRRVNPTKFHLAIGQLTVRMAEAQQHISDCDLPSLNSNFNEEITRHD